MKPFSGIALRVLPLIVFSLAVYFGAQHFSREQDAASPPEVQQLLKSIGSETQDFSLPTITDKAGAPFRLSSLKGKGILVNFWATWCAPCVRELPDLVAIARKYRESGLRIVAVSVDKDWDAVERFFTRYPALAEARKEFTIVLDRDAAVATKFGATQFPESFLINRDFVLDLRLSGEQAWQDPRLEPYYDRILRK